MAGTADPVFSRALAATLAHEGGYVDDPEDPGGETNFGISKRTCPDLDIRSLTREQAAAIYHRDFWLRFGYDRITHPDLAAKLFDICVNMGPDRAHRLLQKALNDTAGSALAVDGSLGPATLAAVNAHPNPAHLLCALRLRAVEFYLSLNQSRFLAGWLRRALG